MKKTYDTLIIGTGCAGYHAAERLYELGVRDIAIITEGQYMGTSRNTGSDKQTYYKLSLAGDDADSVRALAENLYTGGGVRGDIALIEAAYSARCFMHLVELGVPFPKNEYGEYAGYKTDHDPRRRATSCGPLTSKYMTEALEKAVFALGIEIIDGYRVVKIITEDGEVKGIAALHVASGEVLLISCRNVILCTGGPAGIYENSVYPMSQHGGSGLAIEAGADMVNLEEWQYGIASKKFRWNLSGTYQQVLPRYISVDADGETREFLYDALGDSSLGLIFLKGYQWPFDTRKRDASSKIDLLVAREIKGGRRVFLDFTKNPRGLEAGFSSLSDEAYSYLKSSDALFGTPIERLEKMNSGAIRLYADNGIDIRHELLEIAVSAQHCNGGVAVDTNWESSVRGLYAAGEAAGTFGVYRPGGSALNSTQVGSLRAAEHIAKKKRDNGKIKEISYTLPNVRRGKSNAEALLKELAHEMSVCADFERDVPEMEKLYNKTSALLDSFGKRVFIKDESELYSYFKLYDAALTMRSVLSAMIYSARKLGTHGSAYIKGDKSAQHSGIRATQTLTRGTVSSFISTVPIPSPELWFEKLLAASCAENKR